MLIFMDPITCPHATCKYEWTPRKENPKKCPQCQNSLWQSPRPKRSTISRRVNPVKFKPTEVPVAEDETPAPFEMDSEIQKMTNDVVDGQNLPMSARSQIYSVLSSAKSSTVDPLAERKARVQSLLAGVL